MMGKEGCEEKTSEVKINRMIKDILELEQENLKTKKYDKHKMIDKIRNIIEEEVRKCY